MVRSARSLSAALVHASDCTEYARSRGRFERTFPRLVPVPREPIPLLSKDGIEIRLADGASGDEIDGLVSRMYRQRGYLTPGARIAASSPALGHQVTLEARHEGCTVGTLTVNPGSMRALNAEELYADEILPYRARGGRVCEFTRLALDSEHCNKPALGCLFHIGFIFAFHVYRAADLFIEVNPRHALFYQRKLNFELAGEEKMCARVSAPAVLLHKDLAQCAQEIARFGGERVPENRTFYAFMLTPREEQSAVATLFRLFPHRA